MLVRNSPARLPFLSTLPAVVRRGFAVVLAGAVVDTVYHVMPRRPGLAAWGGLVGHLVTLVGMAIVMAGVVGVALKNRDP
jgi:hypothetical protein